jgi:glyoxylase-like metal-dependent hydrolase (beta-lactamase superfamily II)
MSHVSEDTGRGGNWTATGTFKVAPGIYRIPLPLPNDGLRAVNVYALVQGSDLVLIDSGWALAETRAALDAGLAALDCSLQDVRHFFITHVHRDHYTQAIYLRREFGTQVSLGIGDRPSLEAVMNQERPPLTTHLDRLRLLGAAKVADDMTKLRENTAPDPVAEGWEVPDHWLRGGEKISHGHRTLHVIETPGHTRGHVVFHDPRSRLLFAGDHVLPTITPSIGFEPRLSPNPLGAFLGSLALVRQRPDAWLLPAHGPVTASVHARVDELVAHHAARLDEAEAAVRRGSATAYEIAMQLRWTRHLRQLDELDPFSQMLAVTETGAHLDLLAAQGRMARTDEGGLRCYTIT